MSCDADALEEWVLGTLPPARTAALEAHASGCLACAREVRWLLAERRALHAPCPAPSDLSPVRRRVEAALDRPRTLPGLSPWWAPLASAVALTAVVLLSLPKSHASCEPASAVRLDERIASVEAGFGACLLATPGTEIYSSASCR